MAKLGISDKDKKRAENLELRSHQLREILGQVPRWIIRYGTILILSILLLLFIGSALLRYPDVITAPVKLTTEQPPAELTARVSGRIYRLFIVDRQEVRKEEVLAVLESAANYKHIQLLSQLLGEAFNPDSLLNQNYPDTLTLGSVQNAYAIFQKRIEEYNGFKRINYYNRKLNSVKQELSKYSLFMDRLQEQEKVLQRDYLLVDKQFKRDSNLFQQQVISSSQLEKSEASKLSKLYELKDIQTKLASAQIEFSNLQQEILELELNFEDEGRQHLQSLREAFEMLNGQLALWEEKYIIRSPFNGIATLNQIWSDNQSIEAGQIVVTVLPKVQGAIIGKILLPVKGAGKIREGHKVVMRFENYPYMEFGTISGRIVSVSLVPNNNEYAAEVRLNNDTLVSNYGIKLNFQQNMPGFAEIITDQRSLLGRILDPFRSAINRQQDLTR